MELQQELVEQLFEAALALELSERSQFLNRACADAPEVLAAVEDLLNTDRAAASFLAEPLLGGVNGSGSEATTVTTGGCSPQPGQDSKITFAPGHVLNGRYAVVRFIAKGGMGEVYEVEDRFLQNQHLALKTIRRHLAEDAAWRLRFEREVVLARKVVHPNLCPIYNIEHGDSLETVTFLTMKLLEGETLAARLSHAEAMPPDERMSVLRQLCDGLSAIHRAGIIHRDIKPNNVMLEGRGVEVAVCITDFGLAHERDSDTQVSGKGLIAGTPDYIAPEVLSGHSLSQASDLFALGVVAHQLFTGEKPGRSATGKVAFPIPGLRQKGVPEAVARLIEGCLSEDPQKRIDAFEAFNSSSNKARTKGRLYGGGKYWAMLGIGLALLAGFLAVRSYNQRHQGRSLTDRDTIVMADFANSTGEAVFDDALKTALTVSLAQSPFLNVLSDNKVSETIKLMDRPPNTLMTPQLAQEVCERAGSKAFIAGSIAPLGSQYVLGLKAVNCQSGDILAQEQVSANGKEKVLDALGKAASDLRGRLGESVGSVHKYDVPLAEATTPSLEALKALSLGRRAYLHDTGAAMRYFQEAAALDPNFAMAYHDQGRLYFSLGEMERGRAAFAKAFELQNHSSEREKLEITATYYENVTGELEKALDTRKEQVASYPRLPEAYDGLGYTYGLLGRHETAINMFRQSIQLNPDSADTYGLLAYELMDMQQYEEARKTVQQAHSRSIDALLLHSSMYGLAFLKNDAPGMVAEERWLKDQPQYEDFGLALASDSEGFVGHLHNARELSWRSVAYAIQADLKERGALQYENAALREAAFGNREEAEHAAASGLEVDPASLGAGVEAALAYAIAGDNSKAESLARDLNKRFSPDTQVQSLWIPAIRAQVALNRGKPSSALEDLKSSIPIEFGNVPFSTIASCLYPTYIRGNAYLAAGQGKLAASEFQKILDHSGNVWNCWTGSLAYLGIARATALQTTTLDGADPSHSPAISAYRDFFSLWKDADPDTPILKQAKSEYAKLM
jgi:tetratricopeptide (TPR) repeat protein